jgi:hypothetical protein
MAMARCTASASASGGRVSAWYIGAVLPSASARAISTSITLPFSACMQMSAPFFAVCESALKMVPSSTIRTLG